MVTIVEDFLTDRGRRRQRAVSVDLAAIRAEFTAPSSADLADWEQLRSELRLVVGESTFELWLADVQVVATDSAWCLVLDCPSDKRSWVFGWGEKLPGERLEDLLTHPAAAYRYTPPLALQPDVAPDLAWRDQLRIIPCTDALADVAADLPENVGEGYEKRLREVLDPLRSSFDLVLLDTPPGRGNLSGMAVLAADGLLIPALAADLDVRGAGKLYDLVEGESRGLRFLGVLIAASARRWRITRDASARMHADEMRVLPVHIPRAVRVASAPRYRAPTAVLEPDSMVSHAYRQLAHHLLAEIAR